MVEVECCALFGTLLSTPPELKKKKLLSGTGVGSHASYIEQGSYKNLNKCK